MHVNVSEIMRFSPAVRTATKLIWNRNSVCDIFSCFLNERSRRDNILYVKITSFCRAQNVPNNHKADDISQLADLLPALCETRESHERKGKTFTLEDESKHQGIARECIRNTSVYF